MRPGVRVEYNKNNSSLYQVFNCPANLASHRRWHKPRVPGTAKRREAPTSESGRFPCQRCGKLFRRQAYLRKHMLAHEQPENEPEKELSAFRQVHTDYNSYQPVSKRIKYNIFQYIFIQIFSLVSIFSFF